ncbi:cell division protein ZipA [Marinobacter oulmenensis]|uniref:Cell division protein ZipA n=1 Tax=Marinobacter oulmenensis TaxID=643747 RepID=A0A840U5J0_9GAMM|nr:cell division protein ZipA [Marinobacter oulmenensis]MBB5320399.1 cell division protein ZipA [Marinobacter oulmenensis]
MSLREWLIAIGALVILGIVIDGIRRMRRARKESMAISSSMGADDLSESPLDDDYNPELPNGGARTISRGTLEERGYVTPEAGTSVQPEPSPEAFSSADEDVTPETGWGAADDPEEPESGPVQSEPHPEPVEPSGDQHAANSIREAQEPPVITTEVEQDTARRDRAEKPGNQPLAGANRPEAREVVVINVLARPDEQFEGSALKKLFEACGLEHGDMDIYHRHEGTDTHTPVQFSVASAVEPGTFRPSDMPGLKTPGISFFMSLPGPTNAMQAFDFMLETAQCVVRNLGGELKDERRSVMTPQTIEHCRQQIREFERKQRSQRP